MLTSHIKKLLNDNNYPILIDEEAGRVSRLGKFIDNSIFSSEYFSNLYKSNNKRASVMSVSKYNYPIEWATTQDKSNFLKPYFKNKKNKIQKNIFCEAGMFVIYQKNYLINQNKLKYIPYEIPIWETVDIDTIEDFRLAKKLLKISKR